MVNKMPAISVKGLSKRYGNAPILALDDLNLHVEPGEIYGFLGPNGAGKSTAIRLLMNYIQPTSGEAYILGKNIVNDSVEIKKSAGYLSGDFSAYPKMTGNQYIAYLDELQGNGNIKYARDLARRLKADLSKKIGDLSRGNRQKIGLIQALMHQPKILILDEPTSGLDPLMQEEFYKLTREAKERGAAVFVSSHILSEVQKMCDRVGIIREGKLVDERSIKEMAKEAAHTFEIVFEGKPPISALKKVKGVKVASRDGSIITIHLHGSLSPLFAELSKHKVVKIDARNLDLEEVFLHYYQSQEAKK